MGSIPRNPIIFMGDLHKPESPPDHPNSKLSAPSREPDHIEPDGRQKFWFEEMIMLNYQGYLKKLSVCPETRFLMYLQDSLPLKWIVIDPMWGNDKSINAAFQAWVIERTVLGEKTEDRS